MKRTTAPKILFIKQYHYTRVSGGAEEQCWLLATELARRGWDVHYASEMNTLPNPSRFEDVQLHGLPENPSLFTGNRSAIARLMRELTPDVVYARSFDIYTSPTLLEAPKTAVRIWASAMSGDGFIFPRIHQMRKTLALPLFLKRAPVFIAVFAKAKYALRRANIIFVQRPDQIAPFRRRGLEVVHFRNVQPSVSEQAVQKHEGRPVVLWAASIKTWKRPEKFLELATRCADLDLDFIMIGALQDTEYETIIAETVKNNPRFRWDGPIPITAVREYFAKTHLFVNTSIQLEGFPNSFIHAWLYGIPVLSLGVDPEGLLSKDGLGIATHTMDQLEQALRDLIGDPVKRRAMGARARAFANAEFDLQRNVDRLEELIAQHGVTLPPR